MEAIYERDYCQNCGRTSHCGVEQFEELKNYNEPPTTIKICNTCRCRNCSDIKEYSYEF